VITVTSLAGNGPGTLQDALDQNEPRIVVFAVSGVIEADVIIPFGDLTIAGQTAPGAGITIAGQLMTLDGVPVENLVIRHLRVRPGLRRGDGTKMDAIRFERAQRVIVDHVSASFAVDETVDIYRARDVTVQWSVIESSATEGHPEGVHNYGLINGPDGVAVSVHHNLFAHHKARAPAVANGPAEIINNVMYNVRHGVVHHNPATGQFNIIGNYFKRGPSDVLIPFYFDDERDEAADNLTYHLADNYIDDPSPKGRCNGVVENPWEDCTQDLVRGQEFRSLRAFDFRVSGQCYEPVTRQPVKDAYRDVLMRAGAFPRDAVTRKSVRDTRDRTGAWGRVSLGLMDGLSPEEAPKDSDGDGIPDEWERRHGFDPADPADAALAPGGGYTVIERYINELADRLLGEAGPARGTD